MSHVKYMRKACMCVYYSSLTPEYCMCMCMDVCVRACAQHQIRLDTVSRVRSNQSQECGGRPSGCREGEVMRASSCSASEVASVAVSACASRQRAFSSWRSTGGMPLMPSPACPSETKEGSRLVWVGPHYASVCRADGAALRSEHAPGTLPIHHPYPRRRSRSRSGPGPQPERAASGVAAPSSARVRPQRR